VAIGASDHTEKTNWIGSGFLYGRYQKTTGEVKTYSTYLVTNRHVLENREQVLRFNPIGSQPAKEYLVSLKDSTKKLWFAHPKDEIDLAIAPINVQILKQDGIQLSIFVMMCMSPIEKS
jgi:hypothetical protein